ncbi:MAG: glycosyltransferase [Actinomycetota bacterium]
MTSLVAPGNDYRALFGMPEKAHLRASVVIPVYNRVELLSNVLAGLSVQETDDPFEVLVVDDGSSEDVRSVVAEWEQTLDVRYLHQDRDGRGAGRARNRGARAARNDVLVFVDADCIPNPGFVQGHVSLHRRADNLVLSASRVHIDRPVDTGEVISDFAALRTEASGDSDTGIEGSIPDDWRRVFYRRTQRLLLGDEAYRGALSGLMSVLRWRFLEVGGFDDAFRSWGGEDTELGWRLWNSGCFVVPLDEIVVLHQRHLDLESGSTGRSESRKRVLPLVADRVPHSFYRKEPSHLHSVPKLSWIVAVDSVAEADRAWRETSRATYTDTEVILVGDDDTVGNRVSASDASRDLSVVPDFAGAVALARGEVLAIADGRSRFDRRLLARMMTRFRDPRVSAVRGGYKTGSERLLRLEDLGRVDTQFGREGLPFFGLIKRRELMKDRQLLDQPGEAWLSGLDRSKTDLLVTDLIEVPAEVKEGVRAGTPGPADIKAAGAAEIVRGVKRAVRPTRDSGPSSAGETEPPDERVGIAYVGFSGNRNLGDDAMLEAIRSLMPWARIEPEIAQARAAMVGGGTLFNAGKYYLNKVRRVDGPHMERVVFGTGVRSSTYWGMTETYEDWEPFLDSALSIGVRGPDSLAAMRSWGYDGPIDVIGDPALSLRRPDAVARVDGRVVLSPLHTGGECWGSDDGLVMDRFASIVARLAADGREVVVMTAHPADDRWAIEIMRRAGHPDLSYLAGYEDLDATLRLLASADLVIGERLHAVVLAAAVGTPFVGVEYRPKLLDFARSIDSEEHVVRTDRIDLLDAAVDSALDRGPEIRRHVEERVQSLVARQRQHASMIAAALGVDDSAPATR